MPTRKQELLHEALMDAALAGAKEIREFLGTYRGKDPERLRRVQIACAAVSGYIIPTACSALRFRINGSSSMKTKRKPRQLDLFSDRIFDHDIRRNERAELRDSSPRPSGASMRPLPKRRRDGPHR